MRALISDATATGAARLEALAAIAPGLSPRPESGGESNNHIHTCYSFSPYTPSAAALRAYESGLEVAGSVDHDSISAAGEMREACRLLGLGCVTGCEVRVSFARSASGDPGPFARRKINNPDSEGIVYMTIQGVPAWGRSGIDAFLAPIRARRAERTDRMTQAADALLRSAGAEGIDFLRDVRARSRADEGGGITERHLLAAVSDRIIEGFGRGPSLAEALETRFGVPLSAKQRALVSGGENPHLAYDMLGILKAGFLDRIFIQPGPDEALDVSVAIGAALAQGGIPAYAYLGDVAESPTGDKKAEKFEDDYLEELFVELKALGFPAVTYMPPRNTPAQLARVRELCSRHGLMEISGVDINQPRQSFNCPELRMPEFRHLTDSTWAMVAHEAASSADPALGLFSAENPHASLGVRERVSLYARVGRDTDTRDPLAGEKAADALRKGRPAP